MRHFETRAEAKKFIKDNNPYGTTTIKVFKKLKGMKNRFKKPFLVGSYFEWLNQY